MIGIRFAIIFTNKIKDGEDFYHIIISDGIFATCLCAGEYSIDDYFAAGD
jgi:hypothetical protein